MAKEKIEKKVKNLETKTSTDTKSMDKSSFQTSALTNDCKKDQNNKKEQNTIQWCTQIIRLKPKIRL